MPELKVDGLTFCVATSREEKEEIFRLRYEIYKREMKRRQLGVDDDRKMIVEEIDAVSTLLTAHKSSELIGSSRITEYRHAPTALAPYYGIDRVLRRGDFGISEGTKLLIKRSYRGAGSNLGRLMVQFGYQVLRELKVMFDFLNANPYLENYYKAYGYRRCGPNFRHPELLDDVIPMVLVTEDYDYLRAIASPLMEVARSYPASPGAERLFQAIFSEG